MTAAVLTTDQIASAIDWREARLLELEETKEAKVKIQKTASNTVARAVANNRSEDTEAARQELRAVTEQIAEIDSAMELLNREVHQFGERRVDAEKREARERAELAVAEAYDAMNAVIKAVGQTLPELGQLARVADSKINYANGAEANALRLNGQIVTGIPRVTWSNKPRYSELLVEVRKW